MPKWSLHLVALGVVLVVLAIAYQIWTGRGGSLGVGPLKVAVEPDRKESPVVDGFPNLTGLYSGSAEGRPFELCLKRTGDAVVGTMSWPGVDARYSVDYRGTVEPRQVRFDWNRFANHPNGPDSGTAIMAATSRPGEYNGYWESKEIAFNRQEWALKKVADTCFLTKWDG